MGNVQQYCGRTLAVGKYHVLVVSYLGEGGTSYLFKVQDVASKKLMVLKRISAESKEQLHSVQREINLLKECHHDQIVQYYDSHIQGKQVFILMEYCENGNLFSVMERMGPKRFSQKELLSLFRAICKPVEYLHYEMDPFVAHRDLKPENFLLTSDNSVKLCDFGSAVRGVQRLKTKEDCAFEQERIEKQTTRLYRPPEMVDLEGTYMFGAACLDEKVDVWALGCMLYTLAFFQPPFPLDSRLGTDRFTIPKDSPYAPEINVLLREMLKSDAEERVSVKYVLEFIEAVYNGSALPKKQSGGLAVPIVKKANKKKQVCRKANAVVKNSPDTNGMLISFEDLDLDVQEPKPLLKDNKTCWDPFEDFSHKASQPQPKNVAATVDADGFPVLVSEDSNTKVPDQTSMPFDPFGVQPHVNSFPQGETFASPSYLSNDRSSPFCAFDAAPPQPPHSISNTRMNQQSIMNAFNYTQPQMNTPTPFFFQGGNQSAYNQGGYNGTLSPQHHTTQSHTSNR